jgi:hypothetical protein
VDDIVGFGEHVNGEFVAGCLIATVAGKKQYLHRDGAFTRVGREMYLAWEHGQSQQELDVAIANPETQLSRKQRRHGGDNHG